MHTLQVKKSSFDWSAFIFSFAARIPLAIIYRHLTSTCQSCRTFKSCKSRGRKWNNFSKFSPCDPFLSYFLDSHIFVIYFKVCWGRKHELWSFLLVQSVWHLVITFVNPSVWWLCTQLLTVVWVICPLYMDSGNLTTATFETWDSILMLEVGLLFREMCFWNH